MICGEWKQTSKIFSRSKTARKACLIPLVLKWHYENHNCKNLTLIVKNQMGEPGNAQNNINSMVLFLIDFVYSKCMFKTLINNAIQWIINFSLTKCCHSTYVEMYAFYRKLILLRLGTNRIEWNGYKCLLFFVGLRSVKDCLITK